MIDHTYKPYHLPQISAPFKYMVKNMKDNGVAYKLLTVHPKELFPSQGIVSLDKISKINHNNIKPIWVSIENKILDGHHRYGSALANNVPIKIIKILLNHKDAIRILNKIQDLFEFENQMKLEEVVAQDQINAMNQQDSGVSASEFLGTLEIEDKMLKNLLKSGKGKKMCGYRKVKLNEKSNVGNFFSLKNFDEQYNEYEMEFDNLLDTDDMGITYHKGKNPVFILAKTWFPNIDFENISKKYGVNPYSLCSRAVAEKAKSMNYDGIKYGDIMIQGL